MIWKIHHSLMDGVSAIMLSTAMSDEYKKDYFIPTKDVSLVNQILLKVTATMLIFQYAFNMFFIKRDKNVITANKRKMTGKINVASSPNIKMEDVKALSKNFGVTINDILLSALSASLAKYFKSEEDPKDSVQIMMPAMIRWSFYKTPAEIVLENKIAAIPLKMPLKNKMSDLYTDVSKLTKNIKSNFP